MGVEIFLGLGTNLGDRQGNLRRALQALGPEVKLTAVSPVYETPPWGYVDQPPFLNQVAQAETDLSPLELLAHLKRIEAGLGRQPTFHYGPRLIDLDILFYDQLVLNGPELVIPHPHLAERAFVLVPLADLAPEFRHPVSGETVTEMLAKLDVSGIQRTGEV